ncbi:hypothetical protein [Paenibacillus konkukensis]|uniref:hypothetical protein n=1 Tax=Paenibacillus konkukensis TaxID=2020716 RepID=UPI00201E5866|nr:hypothetical protein [Paenibacillus konkukensis]
MGKLDGALGGQLDGYSGAIMLYIIETFFAESHLTDQEKDESHGKSVWNMDNADRSSCINDRDGYCGMDFLQEK